jgi:hypothetical protein
MWGSRQAVHHWSDHVGVGEGDRLAVALGRADYRAPHGLELINQAVEQHVANEGSR